MKKNIIWSMLTIVMVGLLSVGFVSCGDDDDDQESQKEFKPWISGLVRGYLQIGFGGAGFTNYSNAGLIEFSSDLHISGNSMTVIDFRQDGTVLEYHLQETEVAIKIKEAMQEYQGRIEPIYDGTWTLFEGHPEWSYFQGKVTDRKGNVKYELVSPKKYTYSLDTEKLSVTAKDENGKEWDWGTLYINFNPSKTAWSELRNSEDKLMFYIWKANDPLDNSKFDSNNN